ncbi:MAG: SDR family oxidoreductase [Rhodanobacter sp.]
MLELDPAHFESAWRVNCHGAFLAAREVLPAMLAAGAGTILCTGATAALREGARFAGLAVGKFGLRALAQSMARELGPRGSHVAHVVIDGQIGTPAARESERARAADTLRDPATIAESYWQLPSTAAFSVDTGAGSATIRRKVPSTAVAQRQSRQQHRPRRCAASAAFSHPNASHWR